MLRDMFNWIRFRTYDKYNAIYIKSLEPSYYDSDTRLLHGMFQLLVDFVEIECAGHQLAAEKYKSISASDNWNKCFFGYLRRYFRRPSFLKRNPEAGLRYLDWEIALQDEYSTSQAESAKEKKELYLWWKTIYPERRDPMDESGWSELCDRRRKKYGNILSILNDLTDEEHEESSRILEKYRILEELQYKKDEEMLIRLVKIRNSLWT